MNFNIVKTIFFKELKDTLRDSKTLIVMILLPVLLYPLLAVGGSQLMIQQGKKIEEKITTVAVSNRDNKLVSFFQKQEKLSLVKIPNPQKALREGRINAYVEISPEFDQKIATEQETELNIFYDQANLDSLNAAGRLRDALQEYQDKVVEKRITARELSAKILSPLKIESINVAPKEKIGGFYLGNILPLLIIFMTILGAFYPAIDQTAGEKERGTLETLLTTPVKKYEIITGKFLTVSLFAFITGFLNLGSMVLSMNMLLSSDKINFHIPWFAVLLIFVILIPTTMFFVALMILVASLANSFKDAQNYLTPVYIICGFPAMVTTIPGVNLTFQSALIPVANVSLLMKELLMGNYQPDLILMVLGSTIVYSAIAIAAATSLFNREEVLLSDESNLRMLFFDRQSKFKKTPNYIEAITLYIITFGLLFYVGSPLQAKYRLDGLLITEIFLVLVPALLFCRYLKFDFRETFSLKKTSLKSLLASAMLSLSSGFFVFKFVIHIQDKFLPMPEELKQAFMEFLKDESGQPISMLKLVLIISLSAAFCEEFLFRGAILAGLRERFSFWPTIIITGLLFGLFHMSIYRLLPTAALGIVITYIVIVTGSIYNGILFHLLNNGSAVIFELVGNKLWMDAEHDYWYYYPLFIFLFAFGIYLLQQEKNKIKPPSVP